VWVVLEKKGSVLVLRNNIYIYIYMHTYIDKYISVSWKEIVKQAPEKGKLEHQMRTNSYDRYNPYID
jgi:hypothetical protein